MVPLLAACCAAGHEVVVATGEPVRGQVEATGARFVAAGTGMENWFERLRSRTRGTPGDGLPPNRIAHYFAPRLFAEVIADDVIDGVLAAGRELRPDVVVFDAYSFAGPLAARLLGVPGVQHMFGPLTDPEVLALVGDAVSPLWRSFGQDVPAYAGVYADLTVAVCPPSLEPRQPPAGALTHIRPVPSPSPPKPSLPPLVYVTFGTMWADAGIVETVLEALSDEPVEVIATVGALDPDALATVPANARVERYVPQSELLPRCTAVVHHAGSGTMLGALAHGLPQVALPQAADNFVNAAALRAADAALVLLPGEVDAASVRQAVRTVLDGAAYRTAAQRIADEIAAMPSPADVVESLAALVARPAGRAAPHGASRPP